MKTYLYTLLIILAFVQPACAQAGDSAEPIEVTADKTLEWRRNEKRYVADGNAMVRQGNVVIRGDSIAADYRDSKESSTDIYSLTATGNVSIENGASTARGEKLVYDVDKGVATMTGKTLTMTAEGQTVTATERFEYNVASSKLTAIGNARTSRGQDTMQAETLSAIFQKDSSGKQSLNRLEAHGNVRIITPAETLTGRDAVYIAADNKAVITGGVKITRGPDTLSGERGEVDLGTNVSRLYGNVNPASPSGDGRVRGVFYPGKTSGNTTSQ